MIDSSNAPDDSDLVWHYTSLSALIPIVKNNSLLATEVGFQNDRYEQGWAATALERLLSKVGEQDGLSGFPRSAERIMQGMEDPTSWDWNEERLLKSARFVLCASVNGDSLYAWRTYGSVGSIGCAIGLDRNSPLGVIGKPSRVDMNSWRDVIYSDKELESSLLPPFQELAERWKKEERPWSQTDQTGILIDGLSELWPEVRARAKHVSWRDEQEARVTVVAPHSSVVDFREGRFGPRPYVRLGASDAWGHRSRGKDPLPIRSIRLGPDAPKEAVESVRWLLAINGYAVDGRFTHSEHEDEDGNVEYDIQFDKSSAISILESKHAYRDV